MVETLGQQYNIGEKPIVILYTYINRHAGGHQTKQRQKTRWAWITVQFITINNINTLGLELDGCHRWRESTSRGCKKYNGKLSNWLRKLVFYKISEECFNRSIEVVHRVVYSVHVCNSHYILSYICDSRREKGRRASGSGMYIYIHGFLGVKN